MAIKYSIRMSRINKLKNSHGGLACFLQTICNNRNKDLMVASMVRILISQVISTCFSAATKLAVKMVQRGVEHYKRKHYTIKKYMIFV